MNRLKFFFRIVCIFIVFPFTLNGEATIIPFRLVNNLIIIEANIESKKGNLILDTGSDGFFLDRINISEKNDGQRFQTLNGDNSFSAIKVKSLTIGGISKKNLDAYSANLSHLERFLSLDLAGIIGTKLFNKHSLYIDFQTNQIYIYTKAPAPDQFGLENQIDFFLMEDVPVVKVKIENIVYDFIFDSGASIHVIDHNIISKHQDVFHKLSDVVSLETIGTTETHEVSKFEVGNMITGNSTLKNSTCLSKDFSSLNLGQTNQIHGILSVAGFNKKGILFDFHRMKIWF